VIQRIQTVYLLVVVFLNAGFLFTPVFDQTEAYPDQWMVLLLSTALTLSTILSFLAIFLYKKRPIQIRLITIGMIAQVVVIGVAAGVLFSMGSINTESIAEISGVLMIVLAWILQFLSVKSIKKDEALVRSIDRIR